MKLFLAALLLSATAFAAVNGTVINRTNGKPQAGARITLTKLGQGMEVVGNTTTDAEGKFSLPQELNGPYLIQAFHQGVNYNRVLPPGQTATNLELEVYNSSAQPGDAKVTQHMVLLEPDAKQVNVSETVIFANTGKMTYEDPNRGTLRFFLPSGAKGQVKVNVTAPQGMPLQRPAEPAKEPNVYAVKFPIKPGETRIDLSYSIPSGGPFQSKILHDTGATRLVAPDGVKLEGPNLTLVGREPSTQAAIYDVKGREYEAAITGTGTLRSAAPAEQNSSENPPIQEVLPRVYDRLYVVLGLILSILAVGFVLLWRHQPMTAKTK